MLKLDYTKSSALSVKDRLTVRYAIGLALIATFFVISFSLLMLQISKNEQDATVINISGQQRMLSQRIGFLLHKVADADSPKKSASYAQLLEDVKTKMRSNHNFLIEEETFKRFEVIRTTLNEMYYAPEGVDLLISSYLDHIDQALVLYYQQGGQALQNSPFLADDFFQESATLLRKLDAVVSEYEYGSQIKIEKFKRLEFLVLFLGLMTLVAEIVFIFRPMAENTSESIKELEIANAELVEFSYRISHDLRAPVASSLGLVEAGKASIEKGQNDMVKTCLDHIDNLMRRLDTLIQDIIEVNKIKNIKVEYEFISLENLIDEVLVTLSEMSNFEAIEIEKDIQIKSNIMVKKHYLQQSLNNLLSNAVKYSDLDKNRPFIKIRAEREEGNCIITISDNGIGIPEESRDKVFGMFQRFHSRVSYGSGLGLYLVAKNMNLLKGAVEYKPQEEGSVFKLIFPVKNKEE